MNNRENIVAREKICRSVREAISDLFKDNMLTEGDIDNLKDKNFSKETFGLSYPVLIEGKKQGYDAKGNFRYNSESIDGKYYLYSNWIESQQLKFETWYNSILSGKLKTEESLFCGRTINVYVAYAWPKRKMVFHDYFWRSIRDFLTPIKNTVENSFGKENVCISIKRMRSSHGAFIYDEVLKRIKSSDMLFFDVAGLDEMFTSDNEFSPKNYKKGNNNVIEYNSFSSNVLLELGMAMGVGKIPFILCPECLKSRIPSDLNNFMWSFYDMVLKDGKDKNPGDSLEYMLSREFIDKPGLINKVRGCLAGKAAELCKSFNEINKV